MTHTPGPWTYDRSSGYIGTDEGVIAKIQSSAGWAGIGKNIIASEQEENGRFIVRACNAHEELVKALEMARDQLAEVTDMSNPANWMDNSKATLAYVEETLRLAEGKG